MSTSRRTKSLVHRRINVTPTGGAGVSTANVTMPLGASGVGGAPGRDIAAMVRFVGISCSAFAATTDIVIKADSTTGATILTKTNIAATLAPVAVGTTAQNATGGATAATDATAGGFPVRGGVNIDIAQADVVEIIVDIWFDIVTFVRVELNPVGGAGTSAVNKDVRIGGPGVIRALSVTFTSQPATTDILLTADTAGGGGNSLWTSTNKNTTIAAQAVTLTGGSDEGGAAIAATDGTSGGMPFRHLLNFDVAQGDDSTNGAKPIVIELWIDA